MDGARTAALKERASPFHPIAATSAPQKVSLDLVKGPYEHRHFLASTAHALLSTLALLIRLPFHLLYHFVFCRSVSPLVQELGRSPLAEVAAVLVRHIFLHLDLATGRFLFSFGLGLPSKWVTTIDTGAVKANWIGPPDGSDRRDDALVLYWVHGGAFTHDTAATCEPAFVQLAQMLNKRGVKFSIFHLHYHLAPEHIYPSQQIEVLAGYHHLVNELGVPEERICVGGDSAGGNLVAGFLLHLARPSRRIKVPKELGPTPRRPGSALLVSPFVDLVSYNASRSPSYTADYIDDGGVFHGSLRYVGAVRPYPASLDKWRRAPSWNPLRWFGAGTAADPPPGAFVYLGKSVEEADGGEGVELLASPHVNPHASVVKDLGWYKEAMPGDGKTLVTWGGKEIFCDDIELFVDALKKAGVAPSELFKPLAAHDWPLFDAIVPTNSRDKKGGEQCEWDYGLRKIADFLEARAGEGAQA